MHIHSDLARQKSTVAKKAGIGQEPEDYGSP